jgi:hypothetical protein
MKPQSGLLTTYRFMVGESRARVDAAIPQSSLTLGSDGRFSSSPEPAALAPIRKDWQSACTALDAIDSNFDDLAEAIWTEYTNQDLSVQARNRRVQEAISQHRNLFDAQAQAARTILTRVLETSAKASAPPRPQPEDALQEARIAGIKSDLTMLLANRADPRALVDEVDEYLAQALASGDKLAVWVVAGSGWLDLYIRSRGEDEYFVTAATASLDQVVSTRLDSQSADPAFDLRQLNRVLTDPQRGVQAILTMLQGFVVSVFNDLVGWSPTSAPRGYDG